MKRIAVVGAGGFVGSAIVRALSCQNHKVYEITRENCEDHKLLQYDILINTAMPSKRFWALNNRMEDVRATIIKTAELLYEWNYGKFIQISSLSARLQLDAPYGVHKKSAEVLVENNKNSLIVRLGALYGKGLNKSALFDMVNHDHIYVDINSEYNYIDIDVAAKWIVDNLDETGIKEVGAIDTISLLEISKNVWENPSYEGRLENIYSENPVDGMPSSREVLKYLKKLEEVNHESM